MPHSPKPLGTFLRGDRDYIQGTQLLARTADVVNDADVCLVQATFSEITSFDVLALTDDVAAADGGQSLGRCKFKGAGGTHGFVWVNSDEPGARRQVEMGIEFAVSGTFKAEDARISFAKVASFEDMLNALVQGLKALHAVQYPDATDIWFTGIRKTALPVDWPTKWTQGTVDIEHLHTRGSGGLYQSMSRTTAKFGQGGDELSAFVTFAFKSNEAVDVD